MAKKSSMPQPRTSITSIDGQARITYDPKFGRGRPFLLFIKGEAGPMFGNAQEARFYAREAGHPFTADSNWK